MSERVDKQRGYGVLINDMSFGLIEAEVAKEYSFCKAMINSQEVLVRLTENNGCFIPEVDGFNIKSGVRAVKKRPAAGDKILIAPLYYANYVYKVAYFIALYWCTLETYKACETLINAKRNL